MKNLCLTTFVFGNKYKEYIPLFIYSIKKAYPEYGVIVFCQGELNKNVRRQLDIIKPLGEFSVVENTYNEIAFDTPRGAALRWLLWHENFEKYQAVYVADIDIFYCKEKIGIYEQHIKHCSIIHKPFSNVLRERTYLGKDRIRRFVSDCKWMNFTIAFRNFILNRNDLRLTGLHFFIVEQYKSRVKPNFEKYLTLIKSAKIQDHHHRGFNDESMLFDLINESELGDNIPIVTSNEKMLTNDCNLREFRPHHGLHLGIFRNKRNIEDSNDILKLEVYREYYKYFIRNHDVIYKDIEKYFSEELRKELNNMNEFFK